MSLRIVLYACSTRILYGVLFLMLAFYIGALSFTAAGSGTILDVKKYPAYSIPQSEFTNSPNAVTAGAASLTDAMHLVLIKAGRTTYGASKEIQDTSVKTATSIAKTSKTMFDSTLHGIAVMGNAIHSGASQIIDVHMRIASTVARAPVVHNFLTPSNTIAVPAINSQTSFEMLEQYDQAQKLQLKKLLEAQITANTELGGQAVAGNANRGGYPAQWENARQDTMVDYWGMFNRECVSYTAWKVHQSYGNMPYWGGIGNANQWISNAKSAGIPTGTTPKIGSVAISMEGYYGHAMWVEAVEGTRIYVSQYNYDLNGRYSEMWIDSSNLTFIYFGEAR